MDWRWLNWLDFERNDAQKEETKVPIISIDSNANVENGGFFFCFSMIEMCALCSDKDIDHISHFESRINRAGSQTRVDNIR